jgi:hypothetical protein
MVVQESPGLLCLSNFEQGHAWSLSGFGIIMTELQQMIESSSNAESNRRNERLGLRAILAMEGGK